MTEQPARLLRDAELYLSALHGSVARHDNLAANLGCAGCELRDRIGAVLRASSAGVAPVTDRPALLDRAAAALHAHDYPGRAWPPEREGLADAYRRQAAAVLAVLPTNADRAAVLREAAAKLPAYLGTQGEGTDGEMHDTTLLWVADLLRRMADETAQPTQPGLKVDDFARMFAGADVIAGRARLPFDQLPAEEQERHRQAARTLLDRAQTVDDETQRPEALVCVCGAPAVRDADRWTHHPGTGDTCLYRPDARPRCPECQMPHVLTPGMALVCASILASIADRDQTAAGTPQPEVVHGCPPDGSGLTPCCGRTPFELPLTDRISSETPITCPAPAVGAQQPKETRP